MRQQRNPQTASAATTALPMLAKPSKRISTQHPNHNRPPGAQWPPSSCAGSPGVWTWTTLRAMKLLPRRPGKAFSIAAAYRTCAHPSTPRAHLAQHSHQTPDRLSNRGSPPPGAPTKADDSHRRGHTIIDIVRALCQNVGIFLRWEPSWKSSLEGFFRQDSLPGRV